MAQLDFFSPMIDESFKEGLRVLDNGEYIFHANFFSRKDSDFYFQMLRQNVDWKQESMNMYGKKIDFPRLTSWYGDNNKPYSFSGITLNPLKWNTELLAIKGRIEPEANVSFNSVLLNLYRNGHDSISWHTDAEKELGRIQ